MFAHKLQYFLTTKIPIPEHEQRKIGGYIEQYFAAVKPNHPAEPPNKIITTYLRHINDLKTFLLKIKPHYVRSSGDLNIFRKSLSSATPMLSQFTAINNPAILIQSQKPNLDYLLFHLLSGTKISNSDQVVTFSFWDKLVVHFILAWCSYHHVRIHINTLLKMVDSINGDTPYSIPK